MTRIEKYLRAISAKLSGKEAVDIPGPITRTDVYLRDIYDNTGKGSGGGGGDEEQVFTLEEVTDESTGVPHMVLIGASEDEFVEKFVFPGTEEEKRDALQRECRRLNLTFRLKSNRVFYSDNYHEATAIAVTPETNNMANIVLLLEYAPIGMGGTELGMTYCRLIISKNSADRRLVLSDAVTKQITQ